MDPYTPSSPSNNSQSPQAEVSLAWAFELTPEGIKTIKTAQEETETTEDSRSHSNKRNWLAYAVGALLPTLIFGALAIFSSSLDTRPLKSQTWTNPSPSCL